MRRGEWARTLAGSDGTHALLFASLTVALDAWLLSHLRHGTAAAAVFLVCLVSTGVAIGLATGALATWVQRRRSDRTRSEQICPRAIRWAATGALFIHLALPALMVADVVAHPQNLIGLLGGTY